LIGFRFVKTTNYTNDQNFAKILHRHLSILSSLQGYYLIFFLSKNCICGFKYKLAKNKLEIIFDGTPGKCEFIKRPPPFRHIFTSLYIPSWVIFLIKNDDARDETDIYWYAIFTLEFPWKLIIACWPICSSRKYFVLYPPLLTTEERDMCYVTTYLPRVSSKCLWVLRGWFHSDN